MTKALPETSDGWRRLSDAELAAEPQARLGGALGVMFGCAAMLPVLLIAAIGWLFLAADPFVIAGMGNMIFADHGASSVMARLGLIPHTMLFVWGIVFTIMTLRRSPVTPLTSAVLIVLWAALAIGTAIAARLVMNGYAFEWMSQAMLIPQLAMQIASAAAFCGYMRDGRRPNLYFLRRIRS